ncbi:MAG: metalloprotease PmbA [Gammaproteobacteria bacterium]|nr:metalloprotease PmbA [Gammaproteobacteria bacterium]
MNDVEKRYLSPGREKLESLIGMILDEARTRGASEAAAGVSVDEGLSVTVRLGEVETIEYQRDRGLGVTVYFGKRKGAASTADLSDKAVRETVAKACSIARYTAEDSCAGLADADRMAVNPPNLDLCSPWNLSPEAAIEIAKECEDAARDFDKRISNSEGASVGRHQALRVYGNSHGFIGSYPTTSQSISCAVLGSEGESMQRDYWYSAARYADELDTPVDVGRRAARRTVARLGATKISTRKAPIIFPAEIARGFFGHLISAISGSSQYRRASFLLNARGKQLFPDFVRLSERPHIPRAFGSRPFDREGVATVDRELVDEGVLTGYVLASYSARRLGLASTGNAGGIHNLLVAPGPLDFEGLVAEMDTGFVVTELMGQGVNTVTGDYSRGASGFWVEGGKVVQPVEEVTIAGNLRDMYRSIVAVGKDIDTRGTIRSGSVLLDKLTIAGS